MTEAVLGADTVPRQIAFDALEAVHRSLAALGRTEDVRFSPDGSRIAFACYGQDRLAVVDVELRADEVVVEDVRTYRSPHIREPHGIDFLYDDRLVVANRAGWLASFALPPRGAEGELTPLGTLARDPALDGPGSVAVRSLADGVEALVCNNWGDSVTRHVIGADDVPTAGTVALRKWLDLPDGLAVSGNGEWLAVSNHNGHTILLYECSQLDEEADPVAILRGVRYPHGLRFAGDGSRLLVADAGAPYVYVFASSDAGWRGARYPTAALRVLDDETFARGRHNPQEGGPKGIDVHPQANVLAVTSECAPLAFFHLDAVLDGTVGTQEEDSLEYELFQLQEAERLKESAASAAARLSELQRTKAWRVVQPPRRAYGALVGLVRGARRGP